MPFSIHWRHGCRGVHSSNSLRETSKGIYTILIWNLFHFVRNYEPPQWFINFISTSLIYLCSFSKLSNAGGRLIIASDGIWDALSSDMAAKSCRGLPAELAARQVVKVI